MQIVGRFIFSETNFSIEYISCNETCITAEMSSVVIPFNFLLMYFLRPDVDFKSQFFTLDKTTESLPVFWHYVLMTCSIHWQR